MGWGGAQIRALDIIMAPYKAQQQDEMPSAPQVCRDWQAQFGSGRPATSVEKEVAMPSQKTVRIKMQNWWAANCAPPAAGTQM